MTKKLDKAAALDLHQRTFNQRIQIIQTALNTLIYRDKEGTIIVKTVAKEDKEMMSWVRNEIKFLMNDTKNLL